MKKLLVTNLIILICLFVGCTNILDTNSLQGDELIYEDIKDEIIRFHVLANSDSEEDQELKLKVRDAVIEYVYNDLKNSDSINESRQYLINNKTLIEEIAKEEIIKLGYTYEVTSNLSKENFPDKMYGDILFPQGEYEAFRILIGEAEGQNWWCVMFPPLCFVDESKETIDNYRTKKILEVKSDNKIIFKSKIFDGIKKIFS